MLALLIGQQDAGTRVEFRLDATFIPSKHASEDLLQTVLRAHETALEEEASDACACAFPKNVWTRRQRADTESEGAADSKKPRTFTAERSLTGKCVALRFDLVFLFIILMLV